MTIMHLMMSLIVFFSINIVFTNHIIPIWFIVLNIITLNSLFSMHFLSRCIKLPVFTWPQRLKWLIFLLTLATKRIQTDEYHPPLQSGRGCDLSSLVLPVFHSGQPMRSPHPVWGRWKMGGGRLLCALRRHPNHFLIYNFTTMFSPPSWR